MHLPSKNVNNIKHELKATAAVIEVLQDTVLNNIKLGMKLCKMSSVIIKISNPNVLLTEVKNKSLVSDDVEITVES